MQLLKQSTAASVMVGPVLDGDGLPYTGAVVGNFNLTKNGTTAALASPATATHSHNGHYVIAFGTGNVDTLGRLDVSMNASGYGMTLHRYTVVTANQFDALITNGTATPAAIASQTRTELTTELARIDVATSTRLASVSYTTPPTAAANADATLSGLTSGPTSGGNWPNGSFGRQILIGSSTQREVAVTGSNHVAADIHELQPAVITSADFATDAISGDAVSSGAVTKIVSGVWSALTSGLSVVGSTGRALARLIGLVENSSGDRFTSKALEEAPAGGGGAGDASQATLLLVKAKTDLITSQTANQQQTPVNQMAIVRGDSYSGATRKTHAVTTDYTGYTATFTIRHRVTDAVLLSVAGAVDSSTQLSVTLTTANTAFALLVDPTEFGPHPYDFRLVNGAVEKTESGIAIIRRDVTRA